MLSQLSTWHRGGRCPSGAARGRHTRNTLHTATVIELCRQHSHLPMSGEKRCPPRKVSFPSDRCGGICEHALEVGTLPGPAGGGRRTEPPGVRAHLVAGVASVSVLAAR